jgi:hypothetical protein
MLRRYVYISDHRLNELVGQATTGEGVVTGRSLQLLGVGSSYNKATPDERVVWHKNAEGVEEYLKDEGKVGGLDTPKDYFSGCLSMVMMPYDEVKPAVLYLTGETELSVVALAGPLRNMVGLHPDDARSREGANILIYEPEVAGMINEAQTRAIQEGEESEAGAKLARARQREYYRWEHDVLDVHMKLSDRLRKRPVNVLAYRDSYSRAEDIDGVLIPGEPRNVLLGKPVFIYEAS